MLVEEINKINIDIGSNNLISVVWFVHNLSIVDSTRFDAVDDVDDGDGRLDGRLVLEVLDGVGLGTLSHLVKGQVDQLCPRVCVANFRMVHFVFGIVNLVNCEFGIEIDFCCSVTQLLNRCLDLGFETVKSNLKLGK